MDLNGEATRPTQRFPPVETVTNGQPPSVKFPETRNKVQLRRGYVNAISLHENRSFLFSQAGNGRRIPHQKKRGSSTGRMRLICDQPQNYVILLLMSVQMQIFPSSVDRGPHIEVRTRVLRLINIFSTVASRPVFLCICFRSSGPDNNGSPEISVTKMFAFES